VNRSHWLPALLIVSLAFNVAAVGSAAYSRYASARAAASTACRPMGPGGPTLSAELVAQVTALRQEFTSRAQPLVDSYQTKNAELAELAVTGSPSDAARIDQLSREAAELHRRIQLLAVDNIQKESSLLPTCERGTYCSALRGRICSGCATGARGAEGR